MRKILFVVDERQMGGVSVVLNDLLHFLDYRKYKVDLLVLHDRGDMLNDIPKEVTMIFGTSFFRCIDYSLSEILKMRDIRLLVSKIKLVLEMKSGKILKRIKKERKKMQLEEYDVEIAFKDGFCAVFTACGNAKKKIHWLHCAYQTFNPNEKYPALFNNILKEFDCIVGVTNNVVKEFNEIYHLENKSEVIPIAMRVDRIKNMSLESSLYPVNKEKLNLVCIGRMHPVKGYDRLIDVLKRLYEEKLLDDVEVHFYGDGPLFETIKNKVERNHMESCIFLKGAIKNPYAELKNYDVLLLPSYSESFGMVISEAFILKVPVFSTKTSASETSIKNKINGWVCDNDEEALYEGLKELLTHREQIASCKENLSHFIYENEKILEKINTLLGEE